MLPGRLLLLLALLVALAGPAAAQVGPGEPFVPEGQVRVNDFWFRQDSVLHHAEWAWGVESLSTWGDLSRLATAPGMRIPLLVYRDGDSTSLQVGAQRTLLRDALLDPLSLRGVRLDRDLGAVRLSLSAGQTMDPYLVPVGPDYRHLGLSLGTPLGRRGAAGVFASTWAPVGPGSTRTLVSAFVDPRLRGPGRVSGAWGVDLGPAHLPLADRRAFRWEAAWYGPSFSLVGRQDAHGRAYGPTSQENFRQGNDTFTVDGRWQLAPELELSQSWHRFRYESPPGQPPVTTRQEILQSQLAWAPRPGLRVSARHRSLLAGAGSGPDQRQLADNLDVWWSPRDDLALNLGYEGLRGELGPRSGQVNAGLAWSVTPQDRFGLTWGRTSFDLGTRIEALEQSGVSYQRTFGDRGRVRAEYRTSSGYGLASSTASLGADLRPDPRWRLSAGVNRSLSTGFQNTALDLGVAWLRDEHTEVVLQFQSNPILTQGFVGAAPAPPQWLTLTLNQSWGGPLETDYRARLRPRVTVRARYRVPGEPDWRPLQGARVLVDGDARTLSADGEARLDLAPGEYLLRLDTQALGPGFEVAGGDRRPLRLEAASREELQFDVTAWSSVRAVVFQDQDGTGTPPAGYVPVADVPVRLDGEVTLPTGADGVARFRRLEGRRARVALPPGALPPGVVATTPSEVEVALQPGRETVVLFGVRGMGRLRGSVRLIPPGGVAPGPGPAGVRLLLQGRLLGTTGPGGAFDVEAPSGRLEVRVDAGGTGLDAYLVTPLPPVDLAPEGVVDLEPVLALRGSLTVRLGRPLAGVPITREDGTFLYTDSAGQVVFRRLPMGTYEVVFPPAYLPAGQRLVGPERRRVDLRSGERKTVEFEIR